MCVYVRICAYACICVHMCVYVYYVCMCVYVYVYVYMCVYFGLLEVSPDTESVGRAAPPDFTLLRTAFTHTIGLNLLIHQAPMI